MQELNLKGVLSSILNGAHFLYYSQLLLGTML